MSDTTTVSFDVVLNISTTTPERLPESEYDLLYAITNDEIDYAAIIKEKLPERLREIVEVSWRYDQPCAFRTPCDRPRVSGSEFCAVHAAAAALWKGK